MNKILFCFSAIILAVSAVSIDVADIRAEVEASVSICKECPNRDDAIKDAYKQLLGKFTYLIRISITNLIKINRIHPSTLVHGL